MIIDGKLVISKKRKAKLIEELKEKGFKPIPKAVDAAKEGENEPAVEEEEESEEDEQLSSDVFDYLLGMPLWSLTQERVEKLLRQIGDKELEIDALIKLSKEDLWKRDLDEFITEWRNQLEDEERRAKKARSYGRRTSTKLKTAGRAPAGKKRKALGDDDDSDFAPKAKKATVVNKVKPKGGLLDYLSKPAAKSKTKATRLDSTKEIESRFEQKPRGGYYISFSDSEDDKDDILSKETDEKARDPTRPPSPDIPAISDSDDYKPKPAKKATAVSKKAPKEHDDSDTEIVQRHASEQIAHPKAYRI
ncbi:hypothetical protein CISG_08743 [Coccidioides immitis RMSCC 3703]|uniref:DNA topoisomerase (ATP-hydrolyzing) n=1 Tax=Coccidioides immitis RMSCC 3703 TaxID=454286 RepID=A0A0J8U3I0_COCIT|nr:hypothetical protein CISG_08743 [Coccidioides immitis RMSCC 3703]